MVTVHLPGVRPTIRKGRAGPPSGSVQAPALQSSRGCTSQTPVELISLICTASSSGTRSRPSPEIQHVTVCPHPAVSTIVVANPATFDLLLRSPYIR